MRSKTASYRVQFNQNFTFSSCKSISSYLSDLGIDELYASPIFKAVAGSTHGYNIVNHNQINPELGSEKEFKTLNKALKKKGIDWLQDIVPNHMAYGNDYLFDVFTKGEKSDYYNFFDIDWEHPKYNNKVIAPVLGSKLNEVIDNSELVIDFDDSLKFKYYCNTFPINFLGYEMAFDILLKEFEKNDTDFSQLIKKKIQKKKGIKEGLDNLLVKDKEARNEVLNVLNKKNNLKNILKEQYYSLEFWRNANKRINYRRFFSVNELICLNINDLKVFKKTHSLIFSLANEGLIDSIRIDHIDGLYDPANYIRRLKKNFKGSIVAEKIIVKGERLPSFNMDGTTGYDFLNMLNWAFIKKPNESELDSVYRDFTKKGPFKKELYKAKKDMVNMEFNGELDNLTRYFSNCLSKNKKRHDSNKLKRAIKELMLWMPIYRTYLFKNQKRKDDVLLIKALIEQIKNKHKSLSKEFNSINFLMENEIECFMQLQKYTGGVIAKGFEDTALYRYSRLLSLNEVGGDPGVFGIPLRKFHKFNKDRVKTPLTMNTTSTHDTKRGEDARARLNVLSEFPKEWGRKLNKWHRLNKSKRPDLLDKEEEYYLYQSMLGSFPFYKREINSYKKRLKEHMIKALREAKEKTTWLNPVSSFEDSVCLFIDRIFENKSFIDDFLAFKEKLAFYGIFNSLSQLIIKITSPGVPDFYQGTELWDLNLTDPDNRRMVDFDKRKKYSAEKPNFKKLIRNYRDGKIKLHITKKALRVREEDKELFARGSYIPLEVEGKYNSNIIAYARKYKGRWAVVIAPRCTSFVSKYPDFPIGKCWGDTRVKLLPEFKGSLKDCFTGRRFNEKEIYVSKAFEDIPVVILSKC